MYHMGREFCQIGDYMQSLSDDDCSIESSIFVALDLTFYF